MGAFIMVIYNTGDDLFGVTSYIVDPTAGQGNYQTIGAALTAAAAASFTGDIFIRPGTYTENPTLVAGVNLIAWIGDGVAGTVIINGKCTATFAGSSSISGIELQTNSDYLLEITGSSATTVYLVNCYLNASNHSALHCTNTSATIDLYECFGNLGTTSIAYFVITGGTLTFNNGIYQNSGGSTTGSTASAGNVSLRNIYIVNQITTSSTAGISITNTTIATGGSFNQTCVTIGGSGTNTVEFSEFDGGSSSAISISASGTNLVVLCRIDSSNTNAITGSGAITYGGLIFTGSSSTINTTTQTKLPWSVAQGGTGASTFTSNGVLYGNAAGAIQVTAQGGSNTVLLGNGGVPSFGSVPNGALTNSSMTLNGQSVSLGGSLTTLNQWTQITQTVLSSTASPVTFSSASITNYAELMFTFSAVTPSSTVAMKIAFSTNGGSSYAVTGAFYFFFSTTPSQTWTATSPFQFTGGFSAYDGFLRFSNSNLTGQRDVHFFTSSAGSSSGSCGMGILDSSVQINAIQISIASGSFTSGTITLYGK